MLSIRKQIMLDSGSWDRNAAEYIFGQFEQYLKLGNITNYKVQNQSISFSGPAYRWAWNGFHFLNFVSAAQFSYTNKGNLHFVNLKMRYTELIILALLVSLITVPAFMLGQYAYAVTILVSVWLLFVGGTIAVSWLRFNWWLNEHQKQYRKKKVDEVLKKLA